MQLEAPMGRVATGSEMKRYAQLGLLLRPVQGPLICADTPYFPTVNGSRMVPNACRTSI
jgi:hypothetical protein